MTSMTNDQTTETSPRMPALFIGHGSPTNAIENNEWAQAWEVLGKSLPRPRAILVVSAHWMTEGTFVHTAPRPRMIHDFWGFSDQLYQMNYPAPGAPEFARSVIAEVNSTTVIADEGWGIDHGAWVVLLRMYPKADIPVFQLSLDISRPSAFHYDLGRELRRLRDRGLLILGSGNIVHNLGRMNFEEKELAYDWAREFDAKVKDALVRRDHKTLVAYERLGTAAMLSVPSPDHFWPLLYAIGASHDEEPVSFPAEGVAYGSIGMRIVRIG
jgi:4,5-DOPA dioxygenase extradiol